MNINIVPALPFTFKFEDFTSLKRANKTLAGSLDKLVDDGASVECFLR